MEELRDFIRRALNVAPAIEVQGAKPLDIDTVLEVPTRFQIPVQGLMRWEECLGWQLPIKEVPFDLKPREPLRVPLQARLER